MTNPYQNPNQSLPDQPFMADSVSQQLSDVQHQPKEGLPAQLKRDEGLRLSAYKDTLGNWTIGYGHKLAMGFSQLLWTKEQAEITLEHDIASAQNMLRLRLPWTIDLVGPRIGVLVNMCFNMSIEKLLEFKRTLELMEKGDWEQASVQMLKSAWATQVGDRAKRLSEQVRLNQWI